jgi:putative FmdB family regulatory protein
MPSYTFTCQSCQHEEVQHLSISDYLKNKDEKKQCPECEGGVLSQKLRRVRSRVDRNSDEIIQDIKEEVRKTVDKVHAGDQKTIENIYGDKVNPYKNRG